VRVVEILLDGGADMNAPAGKNCGTGITIACMIERLKIGRTGVLRQRKLDGK
jgi:hypothetical protein